MPEISVIMPAYNSEKYIAEAIDSILNQTFTDFEFIIIDDGSTDSTAEIIKSYNDSRINYLKNDANSGIVFSLNRGLEISSGRYIARMDSDDISMPKRFELQFKFMERNPETSVVGSMINTFGEDIETKPFIFDTDKEKLKADLLFNSCIAHPTAFIRKSILDKYNFRYDKQFEGIEDYELWWRIVSASDISIVKDNLLNYRIHSSQITKTYTEKDILRKRKFLDKRLSDINISFDEEEKKLFLEYSLNEFNHIDKEKIKHFINMMLEIIKNNEKTGFFAQDKLKQVCYEAVFNMITNSLISVKEKKELKEKLLKSELATAKTKILSLLDRLIGS